MPAVSKAQQELMAIALKHPEKLYSRNKDVAKMSKESLRHFAETKRKNLPMHVKKKKNALLKYKE